MAWYKYAQYLEVNRSLEFDKVFNPGTSAPYHGIYRCTSCGDEIAQPQGHTLPPQNHRQHNPASGPITWKLIVYAVQK